VSSHITDVAARRQRNRIGLVTGSLRGTIAVGDSNRLKLEVGKFLNTVRAA